MADTEPRAPFSKGGFSGSISKVLEKRSSAGAAERRELAAERGVRGVLAADAEVHRLANARLEGWEREKEERVRRAFDRIVAHEWYDRSEAQLSAFELVHINAVREHFAMRRDRLKTPPLVAPVGGRGAAPGSGSLTATEWVDNVNAVDDLQRPTGVQGNFMRMVERKRAARLQREATGAPSATPAPASRMRPLPPGVVATPL